MAKEFNIRFPCNVIKPLNGIIILFFLNICYNREYRLLAQEQERENHVITFQYGYSSILSGKTFLSKGTSLNVGINFARFFSKKIIFGLASEIKLFPGFGRTSMSGSFITDFNSEFNYFQSSSLDSANARVIRTNINNNGLIGNNVFCYGVMLSLFPQKYGGVLLEVLYGSNGFTARKEIFENPFINSGQNDKYPITVSDTWRLMCTIKPTSFFRNTYVSIDNINKKDILNSISISFYYERINMRTAEFNGTSFSAFTSNYFMEKYKIDNRFGIKLGFSFY